MQNSFVLYVLVMAGVTYAVRVIPLILIKEKITNPFLLSLLHYIPYAVLSAMTVPACFYISENLLSGVVGFTVALVFAYKNKSLLTVASTAVIAVFLCELVLRGL